MGIRRANAPQDPCACLKSALCTLPSRGEPSSAYRSSQVLSSLLNKKDLHVEIKIIPSFQSMYLFHLILKTL